MRKSGEKAPQTWGNNPHIWGGALRALHPAKTAHAVAADCGLPARTVEKWIAGHSAPSEDAFLRLILVYGPTLLAALCPDAPEWLGEAARFEEHARLAAEQKRLGARLASLRRWRDEVRA